MTTVEALSEEIKELPPAEQLRLAAGLLEAVADGGDWRHLRTAKALVDGVGVDIGAVLLMKSQKRGA